MTVVACAADPELFFAESREAEAKAVCSGCPVRDRCATEWGAEAEYGVFGGLNPQERGFRKVTRAERATLRDEQVLRLHAEGMTQAEIGRILDVPRSTVAAAIYAAREKINVAA